MLDLGANVNCTPAQLRAVRRDGQRRSRRPSTASSGRPSGCSTSARRRSRATTSSSRPPSCCAASGLNFHGNVEGDDIYKGTTDVVVCDGFVGNVDAEDVRRPRADALRVPQGRVHAQSADASSPRSSPIRCWRAFKRRIDPRRYNGATLVGLKGVVVKSHGGADAFSFRTRDRKAHAEVAQSVLERIAQRIAAMPASIPRSRDRDARWLTGAHRRVHSRIAGTGRYLPARIVTNDELAQTRATRATNGFARAPGIAPAPHRRRRRADVGSRARRVACPRSRRRASQPEDVDLIVVATTTPDMIFPSTACILQAQARRARRSGVRRAGGVRGLRLRAHDRRPDGRERRCAQRAGRRRRDLFAHPRLERPRHVRAVRRRRRRGRAAAVERARHPGDEAARRRPLQATSCACPGRCRDGNVSAERRSCTWTDSRCSSSR